MISLDYIPVYKERLSMFHELPLSMEYAFELLDALPLKAHYQMALQEIGRNPRALGLDMNDPVAVQKRLEGVAKLANTMLALDKKRPEHKRTFGGKLVILTGT